MKKMMQFILVPLCAISFLQASEAEKINAMVMINMENGLASIQKGFYITI